MANKKDGLTDLVQVLQNRPVAGSQPQERPVLAQQVSNNAGQTITLGYKKQ